MASPSRRPEPSDAALVARARRRGPDGRAALATLLQRHRPTALRTCLRAVGGHEALAADAVQEASLHALLALDRLREPERFGAWLTGIALNEGRRALLRTTRIRGEPDLDALASREPGPAEAAERRAAAARVHAAIAALPPGQREAVTLFYLAGRTQAEVADQLGTAEGAVKTRLHKARASLRRQLDDLREEPTPMSAPTAAPVPVPLRIADVVASGHEGWSRSHVVLLEEEGGPRRLPIWIGPEDAAGLALALEELDLPRPGPHALATSLLAAAGRSVAAVRITALTREVFVAEVVLDDGVAVDARPSDALQLALLAQAPILAEPAVLDAAAAERLPADLEDAASVRPQAHERAALARRAAGPPPPES
jgi:RNA polymerase sigma factor (sigma-70 family)